MAADKQRLHQLRPQSFHKQQDLQQICLTDHEALEIMRGVLVTPSLKAGDLQTVVPNDLAKAIDD